MQKKILFAAILVLAAFAGQAQQKTVTVSVPSNQSKFKAAPASKFKTHRTTTSRTVTTVTITPATQRRESTPARKD